MQWTGGRRASFRAANFRDISAPNASSGMDFSFSLLITSIYSDGPLNSLDFLNLFSQSSHRLALSSPSQNAGCPIPLDNCVVPDPLVASLSFVSNSSKEIKIRYILRNRMVLSDSPSGLGKVIGSDRGGGSSARGR